MFTLFPVSFAYALPTDIQGHWAESQISDWFSKDLAKGYADGMFLPDGTITRAEFAAMVNRAFKFTQTGTSTFTDVSPNRWYANEISIAVAAGYITGYADGTFKPEAKISRQEVAVMIGRLMKLDTSDLSKADIFSDSGKIQQWAKGAVGAVCTEGIMRGYQDQTFRPAKLITRAEAIVTIDRAMKYVPGAHTVPEPIASAIDGTVTRDGKGVKGATAQIFKANSYKLVEELETDADGSFRSEVGVGAYDIAAATEAEVAYNSDIQVAANEVTTIELELEEAAVVKGVLEDEKGRLAKQTTMLFVSDGRTFLATTNNKGEFSIPVLPNRIYSIFAYEPGDDDNPIGVTDSEDIGGAGIFEIGTLRAPFSVGSSVGGGGGGGGGGGPSRIALKSITIDQPDQTLIIGDTLLLTCTCDPVNATNQNKTWTSSNNSVATCSSNGLVEAVGKGTSTITVTCDGKMDSILITVAASTVERDPGNTGGSDASFDEATRTFSGTIEYYPEAAGFPPVAGNYVGVKITAPEEIPVDKANATFKYSNAAGNEVTLVNGTDPWLEPGQNYVFYYPLVTADRKSFTVEIDWDGIGGYEPETITISIAADATLKTDKTALTAAITVEIGVDHENPVYVLNEADYTVASWAEYINAIAAAVDVENDVDALQSQIDAAVAAIDTAKANLEAN